MESQPTGRQQLSRWWRLGAAVTAMIMIGNLQYAWTLFVPQIIGATGWKLSQVQLGFTVFIAVMTWAMPLSGWMIDRIGPRAFMSIAGVLVAFGWGSLGHARTLPQFYAVYAIAGLGNSFVYCCSMAVGLKWFTDKRGLASGLIAAGYGSGAALFIPVFSHMIKTSGYQMTFVFSGVFLGALIFIAGQFLTHPPHREIAAMSAKAVAKPKARTRAGDEFNSWEMLRQPQFYLLYAIMLCAGVGGLMASAQVKPIANTFRIGVAAVAIVLSLDPIGNGSGRILWGWVSDRIGRELAMFTAFILQAVFLLGVVTIGQHSDALFVVMVVLVFLTWGGVYSLFPALIGDMFGARNAASNYSLIYSSKGVTSILAGYVAARLFESSNSWNWVFYGSAAMACCAAIGALVLLRVPTPRKHPVAEPARAEGYEPAPAGD